MPEGQKRRFLHGSCVKQNFWNCKSVKWATFRVSWDGKRQVSAREHKLWSRFAELLKHSDSLLMRAMMQAVSYRLLVVNP
jgi:hypothetical protein